MDTFLVRVFSRDENGSVAARDEALPATGETLAQAVYLSGRFPPPALCSGLGRCGRCRMRYLSAPPTALERETLVLSHHDLDLGWRLACLHPPLPGAHVALPETAAARGGAAFSGCVRTAGERALAVDLGTTSVWWRVVFPAGGGGDEAASTINNPQMGAGSDVVSRLAYALEPAGRGRLRALTLDALAAVAASFAGPSEYWCVAANPAMTYILLDRDVRHLARAPYRLEYAGGVWETVPKLGRVWIPPLVSPFVGGDTSAGYASLAFDPARPEPAYPFVLADLGTNGEIVLALSPQEALATSVAMGPALEGINLSFGMDASPGAVAGYRVTANGLEPEILGETAPRGITGTGYLSLLRALKAAGLLAEDGSFRRPGGFPLTRRLWGGSEDAVRCARHEERLRLPGKMYLGATDVEEILKVKAAFSLALSRLLKTAGLSAAALSALYLAGSLGVHLAPGVLGDLGFLPSGLAGRVCAVGNSSLAGAALFLRCEAARDRAPAWAGAVTTLSLAEESGFASAFAEHMFFSWHE